MARKMNINRKLLNPFKGDMAIWVIFIVLAIISLVAVYSSIGYTAIITHSTPEKAFIKHLVFVLATFVGVIALANMNYRRFATLSWFGYLLSLALLVTVLIVGASDTASGSGMNRWIEIPGIRGFQFQPSELAKIIIIVYLARLLALEKDHLHEWETFRKVLIPIFLIAGLILPDNLSTALIIGIVCFAMLRLAPINVTYWRRTLLVIILVGVIGIFAGAKLDFGPLARSSTWTSRIDNWLHFDNEELTQESMARMAVASGRFFGVGIGSTVQARLMTQAHNDLIYAIIIEETGMVGGLAVFLLFAIFYLRCIRIAWKCKGTFGSMTVAGLGTLIFLQAAIHMGVSVGALPVTGQTLPFVSSGGSAYLCMGLALGIIQSVAYDVNKNGEGTAKKQMTQTAATHNVATAEENDIAEEQQRLEKKYTETENPD